MLDMIKYYQLGLNKPFMSITSIFLSALCCIEH